MIYDKFVVFSMYSTNKTGLYNFNVVVTGVKIITPHTQFKPLILREGNATFIILKVFFGEEGKINSLEFTRLHSMWMFFTLGLRGDNINWKCSNG